MQSFNNGLVLARTKEKVTGVEATFDYLDDANVWGTGGSVTWMKVVKNRKMVLSKT